MVVKFFIRVNLGIALLFVFFAASSRQASAEIVISHYGSADPVSEGWTLANPGSLGVIGPGSETTASGLHEYWRVQDADSRPGGANTYTFTPDDADLLGDWYFESSLRLIDGPTIPGTRDTPPMGIIVGDGLNYWSFYLGDELVGPSGRNLAVDMSTPVDFSDFNTFGIRFSQNGVGTADDTADFFVNGNLVFDDIGRSQVAASGNKFVLFGGISSPGEGDAYFESVIFESTVVPEPAGMVLFGAGAVCAAVRKRIKGNSRRRVRG